jgi:hypothetical protein
MRFLRLLMHHGGKCCGYDRGAASEEVYCHSIGVDVSLRAMVSKAGESSEIRMRLFGVCLMAHKGASSGVSAERMSAITGLCNQQVLWLGSQFLLPYRRNNRGTPTRG